MTSAAACCLMINLPPDCAAAVHSAAFWRRQQADVLCFQLPPHALLLTLRFASLPPHVLLRAAQQHADDRRAAAAYGDAYPLFGKPKMLISALLFAPFCVVS